MAEEVLDGANVVASFEEVGGKAVAQGVRADVLRDGGEERGAANGTLEDGFVEVVSPDLTSAGMDVVTRGREDSLPGPVAWRVGVLPGKAVREFDVAGTLPKVEQVLSSGSLEVVAHGLDENTRERSEPIFAAFTVANTNFSAQQVEVLDAEAAALADAKAGSVEQACHEAYGVLQVVQQGRHFLSVCIAGSRRGRLARCAGCSGAREAPSARRQSDAALGQKVVERRSRLRDVNGKRRAKLAAARYRLDWSGREP